MSQLSPSEGNKSNTKERLRKLSDEIDRLEAKIQNYNPASDHDTFTSDPEPVKQPAPSSGSFMGRLREGVAAVRFVAADKSGFHLSVADADLNEFDAWENLQREEEEADAETLASKSKVVDTVKNVAADKANQIQSSASQIKGKIKEEVDAAKQLAVDTTKSVQSAAGPIVDKAKEEIDSAKQYAAEKTSQVKEGIDSAKQYAADKSSQVKGKINEEIDAAKQFTSDTKNKLQSTTDQIKGKVNEEIDSVKQYAADKTSQVKGKVNEEIDSAKQYAADKTSQVKGKVNEEVDSAKQYAADKSSQVKEGIDSVKQYAADKSSQVKEEIDSVKQYAADKGNQVKGKINEEIDAAQQFTSDTKNKLQSTTDQIKGKVKEGVDTVKNAAEKTLPEINEKVDTWKNVLNEEVVVPVAKAATIRHGTHLSVADANLNEFDAWENLQREEEEAGTVIQRKPSPKMERAKVGGFLQPGLGKTFVVPVDGSQGSLLAFQYALQNSGPQDKLRVVHGEHMEMGVDADTKTYISASSKTLFSRLQNQCHAQNRECVFETEEYIGGNSSLSKVICEHALANDASSIIIGSRGLSTTKRLFLGSLSSSLAQNCPCSVTIIKPPNETLEQ